MLGSKAPEQEIITPVSCKRKTCMGKLRRIVGKDERSESCRDYWNISCASN